MKVKILHVLGKLQMGGTETVVMNLYKNIDKEKFEFDFVVHGDEIGAYEKEIEQFGGKIYRVQKYKLYNHIRYKKKWNNLFKEHPEYNIIHAHVRSTASIYLRIAKKYGLKTICHSHSISNGVGIKAIIKRIIQRNIPKYADRLLACSEESAKWLFGKKYLHSNKCNILYNGIEIEKFKFSEIKRKQIRNNYNLSNDVILIGNVGRLEKVKNHLFIIEVVEEIIKYNMNIKIMFCGDGSLRKLLAETIKDKKLTDFFIFVPSTALISDYYSAFDLFLMPSIYEGLGMSLVEAQIAGLKCLASNNIPIESKISNNVEYIKLNKKIWIDKIISNITDEKQINNKIYDDNINKYNIKEISNKLEQIYANLIKSKGDMYEK